MSEYSILKSSAWDRQQIDTFLQQSHWPLRISCKDGDYPLICSLWYLYREGKLWCATHESAKLVELLKMDGRCAFEISGNSIPYSGVRGQGCASLDRQDAAGVLQALIDRYLGRSNASLAQWLLGRVEQEYAISIEIDWLTSWDFSSRMAASE